MPALGPTCQMLPLTYAGGDGRWVLPQGVALLLSWDAQDAAQRGAAAAAAGGERGAAQGTAVQQTGWKDSHC